MKTANQYALKMFVKAREDFQTMRIAMDNRQSKKADGSKTKTQDNRKFTQEDIDNFELISKNAKGQEKVIEKFLAKALKRFPVYKEFLSKVKGVGDIASAWILAEFDIHEATTVSKMWQYAGLNPGLVKAKKRVKSSSYKGDGNIIGEIANPRTGEIDFIIETNERIRGDRAEEGYLLPYNKVLRMRLVGILAPGFIKAQSDYALKYYYPYKERLEKEASIIENSGKTRKDDGKSWAEVSKGHRDMAAKRYMIKMFLKDLYVAWREIEGLPVRPSYQEEYLGKVHA